MECCSIPGLKPADQRALSTARQDWAVVITVGVVALLLRLLHVWFLHRSPLHSVLVLDAESYDNWAQKIAGGEWFGAEVFYQAPLYPYFLGAIYSVFGHDLLAVRAVQALIGSMACVLTTLAASQFFKSRIAGVIAGLMLAVYPPAIFFDGLIQKAVLDGLWMALLLWLIALTLDRLRWWVLLIVGLTLGVFALTRENSLALAPIVMVWVLMYRPDNAQADALNSTTEAVRVRWSFARRAMAVAVIALGMAIVLVPVGLRNQSISGEFLITTSQFGPNFYIGNNPQANGTLTPLRKGRDGPRHERIDATLLAQAETGRQLSPAEVSQFWFEKSLNYIRAQPGHWMQLLWRKWMLTWNAAEVTDGESIEVYSDYSEAVRLLRPVFHFGVLCPLAVMGAAATWNPRSQRRRLWILWAVAIGFAASVAIFYVFARYRYALAPVMCVQAAGGMVVMFDHARRKQWKPLIIPLLCGVAAAVFANWPMMRGTSPRATTLNNLGAKLIEQKDFNTGEALLRRAIEDRPDYVNARINLAWALAKQDRVEEAQREFAEALAIDPTAVEAHCLWGRALLDHGRAQESLEHFEAALAIDALHVVSLKKKGAALGMLGRVDESIASLQAAIALMPGDAEAGTNLASALALAGRTNEAVEQCIRTIIANPEYAAAWTRFDGLLARPGAAQEAINILQATLAAESSAEPAVAEMLRRAKIAATR